MPVCEASSIHCDGRSLAWFGAGGASWRIAIDQLAAIGEYRVRGDDAGASLAFVIDSSGSWLKAPLNANGMPAALEALASALGDPLALVELDEGSNRVIWPPALAAQPLFANLPQLDSVRGVESAALTEPVLLAAQRGR